MVIGGVANLFWGIPRTTLHKIVSDRPQDHEDIRGIIERLGVRLNRKYLDPYVKDLAGALVRPGMLRFYLDCFK